MISSLRWRFLAVMCLAYVVASLATAVVTYLPQQDTLHRQLEARAQGDATILASGAVSSLTSRSLGNLRTFVESIRYRNPGMRYADVIGPNGSILASTRPRDVNRKISFPTVAEPRVRWMSNGDVKAQVPVVENTELGVAEVVLSGATVATDLRNAVISGLLVRLLGLLLFILVSLFIVRYVLRPLSALASAASSLQQGALGTRVSSFGTTELSVVAQAFNQMAGSLEQRIGNLSFLAQSGALLPRAFRDKYDFRPILKDFSQHVRASAVGVIGNAEHDEESVWQGLEDAPVARTAAETAARQTNRTTRKTIEGYSFLIVPAVGHTSVAVAREGNETFSQAEEQIVSTFANQVGVANENARLFESQQEALQVKDQFLSIVSHEFRTPLTTIKGYAQILRLKLSEDEAGSRFADNIDSQVNRLTRMVEDLLDVTRFARAQFDLTRQPMDLLPLLDDVLAKFKMVDAGREISLVADAASYLGSWDRDRLEQVLNNLLANAVKYSPPDAPIGVAVVEADEEVKVTVKDRGRGIPIEDQQYLFERFYRGSGGLKEVKGLGLGLYVTRRIVEAHGGHISVKSRSGEGSEFSFTLPLLQATNQTPVQPAAAGTV